MHGFSTGSTFLVNAEVDSMGGVVDGGVGIGNKPSPRRAAIEKAQADLRVEYDVREERRRELEFLEKGGNPLDFKFGHAASVSVQSTSHTYQHPDQILTSEAKGSFALTASPHGDSVESSGRLGVTTLCEPNSADNFDGENEILESERKSKHPTRGTITPSEHSSQLDGSQNVKESEDSPIFHPKKGQAYRRRNRSRTNRDGPRSSSSDMASRGQNSSLPGRHAILAKPVASEYQFELESEGTHGLHTSTCSRASEISEGKLTISTSKENREELQNSSVKADEIPAAATNVEPDIVAGKETVVPVDAGGPPCSGTEKKEDIVSASRLDESGKFNGDGKPTPNDAIISNDAVVTKGLDSESSCTRTSRSVDGNGNIEIDLYTNLKNVDSNGVPKEHKLPLGEKCINVDDEMLSEKHVTNPLDSVSCIKEDQHSISHHGNGFADKDQEVDRDRYPSTDKPDFPINREELLALDHAETKPDKDHGHDSVQKVESSCPVRPLSSVEPSSHEVNRNDLSAPPPASNTQTSRENQRKQLDKAHEDRVLEEARIIEAKRKRIAELSVGLTPREHRRKSQWDFVLEEMAWLANDFSQERVWKLTAAAQICHRAAFASRLRLEKQNKSWKQKSVSLTLAKAVMEFWHSAGLRVENVTHNASSGADKTGQVKDVAGGFEKDDVSEKKLQSTGCKRDLAVYGYAARFLQYNRSSPPFVKVEGSGTPDVACDIDLIGVSWQDQLTEENLFYLVPPGAIGIYRKSIEQCLSDFERVSNNIQEEVDTSLYDAATEIGYQENDYEEDEGENGYDLPFDSGRSSKKKRKNMKSYEYGGDFGYVRSLDSRNGTPQSALVGKRPANNHGVGSIPTKRIRTASRPRVVGPFGAGSAGVTLAPSRADASSGDTNSFQDDIVPRGSEVDSGMGFENQSSFDSPEISAKPKKKKKIKHPGAGYDPNWQVDSSLHNEQKDHARKRYESYQLEPNGNSGMYAQHTKKPKTFKHPLDNPFDSTMPMAGSVASPVASQMSNMSSQSKIIKLIGGRDRSRKAKGLKVPAAQTGSGSPWTSFEDQALIVLVHDMGPNWELVSDAINSTLRFKCIFRKPQDCKERHKHLMDRTPGDGADSAEDSGSSQPYPSTLPGIPKGSARQLFQQLQRPMEEDTIKSHFEKIFLIGQQLHYGKKQNDNQDLKQLTPVHGSHVVALSQVSPNNLNGVILTPLDLCDIAPSNQDVPLGFQGSHAGGLAMPTQGPSPSIYPSGGLNSSIPCLPGSPSMGSVNNLASQSSQFTNARDARYPVPRSTSLPVEEQQRLQQYNHMIPGRNVQSSNLSAGSLSGPDRGVRILPGGNGVAMAAGMSRSMSISRPGLQGISSSPMLNTALSSNTGGMPSNMNMHSGTASGQGNSMFRHRDALHMVRPGQSSEHQRQMTLPESGSPGVPPFGALSSGFTNQTASPPIQAYAGHHHQQHPMPQQHSHVLGSPHHSHLPGQNHTVTPEQQAFMRLQRDRQIQQRLLQRQHQQQQQQQQLPASGALMTHAQTPSQLPASSSVQNASQIQSPSASQPVSLPPLTPSSPITHVSSQSSQSLKHHVGKATPQGLGRNAQSGPSGLMNQVGKRQRQAQQLPQQYQQSGRQHPQQRQQSQPQQQAKLLKGVGRSNMLMHQNLPMDPSHLNGLTANSGNQAAEKGEQAVHMMQPQGLYSGSGVSTMHQSKPLASTQNSSHLQHQKPYANSVPATPKQVQQIPSHLEGSNQVPAVSSNPASAGSTQGLSSTAMPSPNHQPLQGHSQPLRKAVNQSQPALQRAVQQNRQVNPDTVNKSQPDHAPLEQQRANNASLNAGVQPACVDSTSALPLSSSASTCARRQAQDPLSDTNMNNAPTSSGPVSSPAITTSSGNETLTPVSDGLGERQQSGNVEAHGHGVQFQNTSPLQPILPQKQSQHQLQQLEKSRQIVPQQQPQSQIQAAQSSVLARTPNSRLE
ncbi:chromatin modification-related protein EAF1 B [Spinacia oleracea]|uniref:Chromatin modification-related protein EAF1 B n=1 Tax=Spinacia oleracea TaxID=3562 RepID=A0A9R0IRA6_SPIOL|nr:chromatin modification-related protein EAF1 B-like [Spinacia oleracea]XP_021854032.2 chromatin modification-related protein EAF1 B-like [Spinacia oleracea]